MTTDEQSQLTRKLLDIATPKNLIDSERIAIANEVSAFKATPPKSQSEVLEKAPLLCSYIFRESQSLNLSIKDFIERKIPKKNIQCRKKFPIHLWMIYNGCSIPDHGHIDRLMRYQTTLQRQLSTTIGELIALTKTA